MAETSLPAFERLIARRAARAHLLVSVNRTFGARVAWVFELESIFK
jgi:hypothetical protein